MDENNELKLEKIIFNTAYHFNGGISIEWLENQPYTKVLRVQEELVKIHKNSQPKNSHGF